MSSMAKACSDKLIILESVILTSTASSFLTVQYQLQKRSPWRVLCRQWQPWMVLLTVLVLMGLVSYIVHCLMILVNNPPPPTAFKMASVSFGLLTHILLLR